MINSEAKLFFIDGNSAYFTTKPLKQFRDTEDWNKIPYEYNAASSLYTVDYDFMVFWTGWLVEPRHGYLGGSPYSANAINEGEIAWLRPDEGSPENALQIYAGTTFKEFVRRIRLANGEVYTPYQTPVFFPVEYKAASDEIEYGQPVTVNDRLGVCVGWVRRSDGEASVKVLFFGETMYQHINRNEVEVIDAPVQKIVKRPGYI